MKLCKRFNKERFKVICSKLLTSGHTILLCKRASYITATCRFETIAAYVEKLIEEKPLSYKKCNVFADPYSPHYRQDNAETAQNLLLDFIQDRGGYVYHTKELNDC